MRKHISSSLTIALPALFASVTGCGSNPSSFGFGADPAEGGSSTFNSEGGPGTANKGDGGPQDGGAAKAGPDGASSGGGSSGGGSSGGGSPEAGSSGGAASCTPVCTNRQCGTDGCTGTCGTCGATQVCSAAGACTSPAATSAFVVDATSGLTAISPAIYGVAFAEAKSLAVSTVQRFGGDCASMYNWKTDDFNCGADNGYANMPLLGFGYPPYDLSGVPAGSTGTDWLVTFDKQNHVDTLLTVPMIGWVSKDGTSTGRTNGTSPTTDAVQTTGPFMQQWVQHLVTTFGSATAGGVKYYQLDNEVDNWKSMHPDVHPNAATSAELLTSIETYGGAIKAADPSAYVLIYSPALPSALLYSPADFANIGSDEPFTPPALSPASNNFSTWLLKQLAAFEAQSKTSVFDCLDMHYPTAGSNTVEDVRSLWDPTYDENSWLTQDAFGGPLDLLPRMQTWINANRPGTGICISEYQYFPPGTSGSAADPASGVVEADALGIFGKYGVKLATYWTTLLADNGDVTPTYNAFAMYRNYDGAGGHFGAYSVGATTTNVDLSIYGAVDSPSAPTTLWVMLVNKTTSAKNNLALTLAHFAPGAAAKVYQSVGTTAPHALAALPITAGSVTVSLPALSISLLVVPKG